MGDEVEFTIEQQRAIAIAEAELLLEQEAQDAAPPAVAELSGPLSWQQTLEDKLDKIEPTRPYVLSPDERFGGEQIPGLRKEAEGELYSDPQFALNRRGIRKGIADPAEAALEWAYNNPPSKKPVLDAEGKPTGTKYRNPELLEAMRQKEQEYQDARSAAGREGFDAPRFGGNVLAMASPVARALSATKGAQTWLGGMATGAGSGVGYNVATPTYAESPEEFAEMNKERIKTGLLYGAGAGAAAKPVEKLGAFGWNYLKKIVDPWTEAGRAREAVSFVDKFLPEDRRRVMQAAAAAKKGETVGQAIARQQPPQQEFGRPIVKMEKQLSEQIAGNTLRDQQVGRELTREKVVGAIQKGKTARGLERARTTATVPKYKESFQDKVKITEQTRVPLPPKPTKILDSSGKPIMGPAREKIVTKLTKELKGLLDDPYVRGVIPATNKLAKSKKISLRSNPVQYLHYIKTGLDKQLRLKTASGQDALSRLEKDAVKDVKLRLVTYLKDHSNKYEEARSTYAALSRPVDQAKGRDELLKALRSVSDEERPAMFLAAWENAERTLKRAKVQVKTEFKDVFDPKDEKGLQRVYEGLQEKVKYKKLTKLEDVLGDLSDHVEFSLWRVLSRPVVIANHALANLAVHTKPKVQKLIIEMLEDPDLFVKRLQSVDAAKKDRAINILQEILILSTREEPVREQAKKTGAAIGANYVPSAVKDVANSIISRGMQ